MIDMNNIANGAVLFGLRFLLISTILLGGLLALSRAFPRLPHRLMDYLWKGALVGGVATALLAGLDLQLPAIARFDVPAPAAPAETAQYEPRRAAVSVETDPAPLPPVTNADPVQDAGTPAPNSGAAPAFPWPTAIFSLWAAGAAIGLIVLRLRYWKLRRRLGLRRPVLNARVRTIIGKLQRASGIAWPVNVTSSESLLSPVALGSREVCLPRTSLESAPDDELEGMIAHELAHLARKDPLWLTMWRLLSAVCFFQPLLRPTQRRFQATAEYLCDSWAIRHTNQPDALVRCIVSVAERFKRGDEHSLAVGMASSKSTLLDRANAALDDRHASSPLSAFGWAAVAVAALSAAAMVSPSLQFVQDQSNIQEDANNPTRYLVDAETTRETTEEEETPASDQDKWSKRDAGNGDIPINYYYSVKSGRKAFLVRYNAFLRSLFDPDLEDQPNPLTGENGEGWWSGRLSETLEDFNYDVTMQGVELTKDRTRIYRMKLDGFVRFAVEINGDTHAIEVLPGVDGALHRRYLRNGVVLDVTSAEQGELTALLQSMISSRRLVDTATTKETVEEEETPAADQSDRNKRDAGNGNIPINNFSPLHSGRGAFLVRYNAFLHSLFNSGLDSQPNPQPGETGGGWWKGTLTETWVDSKYGITMQGLELTEDRTRIYRMKPDGLLRLTMEINGDTHVIEVRPGADGALHRRYLRNGVVFDVTSAEQEELTALLQSIISQGPSKTQTLSY